MIPNNISNDLKDVRGWQKKLKIAQQLQNIMAEYEMRKSKLIKYVPTERELKEAMRFYRFTLELYEKGEPNAVKLKEILDSISNIPEEQIKFIGFLEEILRTYPTGEVSGEFMMNIAEKWDVLDYIVEDIIKVIGIKLMKL